ncbi:MAG: hypothetical protein HY613_08610, partial [Candidatus Rokubacteria bacterium]|nr:hypothetical protein [Candidatus Rokubacteria bacterium]
MMQQLRVPCPEPWNEAAASKQLRELVKADPNFTPVEAALVVNALRFRTGAAQKWLEGWSQAAGDQYKHDALKNAVREDVKAYAKEMLPAKLLNDGDDWREATGKFWLLMEYMRRTVPEANKKAVLAAFNEAKSKGRAAFSGFLQKYESELNQELARLAGATMEEKPAWAAYKTLGEFIDATRPPLEKAIFRMGSLSGLRSHPPSEESVAQALAAIKAEALKFEAMKLYALEGGDLKATLKLGLLSNLRLQVLDRAALDEYLDFAKEKEQAGVTTFASFLDEVEGFVDEELRLLRIEKPDSPPLAREAVGKRWQALMARLKSKPAPKLEPAKEVALIDFADARLTPVEAAIFDTLFQRNLPAEYYPEHAKALRLKLAAALAKGAGEREAALAELAKELRGDVSKNAGALLQGPMVADVADWGGPGARTEKRTLLIFFLRRVMTGEQARAFEAEQHKAKEQGKAAFVSFLEPYGKALDDEWALVAGGAKVEFTWQAAWARLRVAVEKHRKELPVSKEVKPAVTASSLVKGVPDSELHPLEKAAKPLAKEPKATLEDLANLVGSEFDKQPDAWKSYVKAIDSALGAELETILAAAS